MQENNMRLIDEAISFEPVKNTFRLGWEFVILNKKFSMTVMVVLLVLSFLGFIPLIGFISFVFSGAFTLVVQMYAGRLIYETENIESFVDEVHKADTQNIIERYFAPALGAYLGYLLLLLLIVGTVILSTGVSNINPNTANLSELLAIAATIGPPLLLIMLVLSYVQPLVQSNIIMANNFNEGFFAVFTVFSADVWRRAMQGSYFRYVSVFGLLIISAVFLFSYVSSIFSYIPMLNMIILIIFLYIFSIMMSVSAVMAKRIVE